ncbi:MAG: hypothetical protein ACK45I_03285, partial [Bacteroidota bacterium]
MKLHISKIVRVVVACLLVAPQIPLQAQTVVLQFGNGTGQNTNTTWPAPYGNWYWGARHQFIIQASEMLAQGMSTGSTVNALAFNVITAQGTPLQDFTIKLAHSTTAQFSTAAFITDPLTTVFGPQTYTEVTGWNTHTFSSGFVWDGIRNIVVDVCFNNTSFTTSAVVQNTTMSSNLCTYRFADAAGNCTGAATTTTTARCNMRLTVNIGIPPAPIPPLANFDFTLGQDTIWQNTPWTIVNISSGSDRNYWDITGYNASTPTGTWAPATITGTRQCFTTSICGIDTLNNRVNFNYTFTQPGYYRIRLTCVNQYGTSFIEKPVYVSPPLRKPKAQFFADRRILGVYDQVQLYDLTTNGPSFWQWYMDPPCT